MVQPPILTALLCVMSGVALAGAPGVAAAPLRIYLGTFTDAHTRGIYRCDFDPRTGSLSAPVLAAATPNPSFLALHPNRRWLYAINETKVGTVSAFAIQPDGSLTLLNQQPTGGTGPCHLALDPAGTHVLTANYSGGCSALFTLEPDGSLAPPTHVVHYTGRGPNAHRQQRPHAHCATFDPAGHFAFITDLGTDHLWRYRFNPATGELAPTDPPFVALQPGIGPRHTIFTPDARHAYNISELGNLITAMNYDPATGDLAPVQTTSTLPDHFQGPSSGGEVALAPSGRFLYASNRGHDSIATFAVDPDTGKLTHLDDTTQDLHSPRHFALDPTGRWLLAANQTSGTLIVFAVDPTTGKLSRTGNPTNLGNPVCILFAP